MSLQVCVSGIYCFVYGVCFGQDYLSGDLLHLEAGVEETELSSESSADEQVQVREDAGVGFLLQRVEGSVDVQFFQLAFLELLEQARSSLVELFGFD